MATVKKAPVKKLYTAPVKKLVKAPMKKLSCK
jgi:hypothetical protein